MMRTGFDGYGCASAACEKANAAHPNASRIENRRTTPRDVTDMNPPRLCSCRAPPEEVYYIAFDSMVTVAAAFAERRALDWRPVTGGQPRSQSRCCRVAHWRSWQFSRQHQSG